MRVLRLYRSKLHLEMMAFEKKGNPEQPEKPLTGREPTSNSTHARIPVGIAPGPEEWEATAGVSLLTCR